MGPRFVGKFRFRTGSIGGETFTAPTYDGWPPGAALVWVPNPSDYFKDPVQSHFAAFERDDGRFALQASATGRFVRLEIDERDEDKTPFLAASAARLDEAQWFEGGILRTRNVHWVTDDGRVVWHFFNLRVTRPEEVDPRTNLDWWVRQVTPPIETLRKSRSGRNVDLRWLDLSGQDLRGVDLRGARLEQARLDGANLGEAKLGEARLSGASLLGTKLEKAELAGAEIVETALERTELAGADLTGAVLHGSRFSHCNLAGAVLHGTDLRKTRFGATDLGESPDFGRTADARTRFAGAVLPHRMLGSDWRFLDLSDVTFTDFAPDTGRVDLQNLKADDALLVRVTLSDADLTDASFRRADLTSARLERSLLKRTQLASAALIRTALTGSVGRKAVFDSARLYATNLTDIDLESCSFVDAYGGETGKDRVAFFTGSVLTDVHFDRARLGAADLTAVVMLDCKLNGAELQGARFGLSFLAETVFDDAHLEGADFEGSCLVRASLRGAHLVATSGELKSATFVEAMLNGADLDGTNLDGVNLRGAIVTFNQEEKELQCWIPPAPGEPNDNIPWTYGATVLDPKSTGRDTLCPDGSGGPCERKSLEPRRVPECWRYDGPTAARRAAEITRLLGADAAVASDEAPRS